MENQETNQKDPDNNSIPSTDQPSTPEQSSTSPKKANSLLVPVLLVIILILLGSTIFFAYHYFQPAISDLPSGKKVEATQSSPTISPSIENDSDGWENFSDSNIGVEFSYPSVHRADLGKMGANNFITEISQDGWDISLVNNYGPTISIYNNPKKLSLEEIFDKRSQYNIETFAEDEKIMVDGVEALLRYEVWDLPNEIVVLHFVHENRYYQISIFPNPGNEDLSQAKKRLMEIMDTFRFVGSKTNDS